MTHQTLQTLPNTGDGNTNIVPRTRNWCFTLNNYSTSDIKNLKETLDTEKYMFQEEIGSQGTPHLQGVISYKSARKFTQVKQFLPSAHWEPVRSLKHCIEYCSKIDTRNGKIYYKGFEPKEQLKIITNLFDWQKNILKILENEPNDRTIHWVVDPIGNTGKTQLIKYIAHHYKKVEIFTGGKSSDICYQIIKDDKPAPKICLFNFCRDLEGKVSYNAIEQVKDGLVASGKYEGGFKIFNSPHVIIFSNWDPNLNKLSGDRWNIIRI